MLPILVTGKVTGTGAAINIPLGFKPKRVLIHNANSADGLDWTDTMADDKGIKTVAAGTRSYIASGGITPYAGVAGPAALTGTVTVAVGSSGVTGSSTKFLTEVQVGDIIAIQAVGVAAIGGGTSKETAYGKVVSITSDTALVCEKAFDYAGSGKSAINTAGIPAGFTIGTDTDVNASSEVMHWIAERSA